MNVSKRKNILLTLLSALFIMTLLWAALKRDPLPPETGKRTRLVSPASIKGISATTIRSGRVVSRIIADELSVKPRRFYIFNIKPFNEIGMTNAKLEYHLSEGSTPEGGDPFSLDEHISSLKGIAVSRSGLGVITRGVIKGFVLEVMRGEVPLLSVSSEEAQIDLEKKRTELIRACLQDLKTGKKITSNRIIWDAREKVFKIPGRYLAKSPEGNSRGKGIRVDLDFTVSLLN
ncbi:MAG: hypothetical protein GTN70_09355 [Deltaproteobacteria bacterium]|nr:hypothetical protein [Deltaproteobacteria bacterium]NIS77983.1 hypothetical protein [Deltaproteobacteria bacterium]